MSDQPVEREQGELDRLLEHLGDLRKPVRPASLHRLSDLSGGRLVRFCEALAAYPVDRRRRIVHSLLELAESSFQVNFDAIFRHCLQDPDAAVRTTAVEGLWEDSSPALVGPLLRLLRSDPSPQVRAAAATSLGRFVLAGQLEKLDGPVESRIVGELLDALNRKGEDPQVRRRALESAAYAGTPEVSRALELAYFEEDEDLRSSAVLGMGRSCEKRWRTIVLTELKSGSAAMRYEAVVASGELGLADAVPFLGESLHDQDREVAEASIWALGQIGGPAARDLLLGAYEEADEETQSAIDDALAEQALSTEIDNNLQESVPGDEDWLTGEGPNSWSALTDDAAEDDLTL